MKIKTRQLKIDKTNIITFVVPWFIEITKFNYIHPKKKTDFLFYIICTVQNQIYKKINCKMEDNFEK